VLGTAIGKLVIYLRRTHKEAVGLDNFLALGLIALAYGVAVLGLGYGFLAVFAAGVALRRVERLATSSGSAADAPAGEELHAGAPAKTGASPAASFGGREKLGAASAALQGPSAAAAEAGPASATANPADALSDPDVNEAEKAATDPQQAPAYMAHAVLMFNEQMERIGEVTAVIMIGMLLYAVAWGQVPLWFVPVLLLLIRPLSVAIGLAGSRTSRTQRVMIGWFGIRGIGSLYYLMYAINKGLDPQLAETLVALTLAAVVVSITVHGISVTPLMNLYERTRGARHRGPSQAQE
jgi:NhaP-type Na+/H+ or K+/H+ antiporter